MDLVNLIPNAADIADRQRIEEIVKGIESLSRNGHSVLNPGFFGSQRVVDFLRQKGYEVHVEGEDPKQMNRLHQISWSPFRQP